MSDTSIRPVTIAEQAEAAARRFMETGEQQGNPHAGTPHEQAWRSAYEVQILDLSDAAEKEASARCSMQ